jgi:glutathione peroxidase
MTSLYDFTVRTADGGDQPMSAFRNKALLIVNVASQCGFTPHYAGLERLYRQYRESGFLVLGFPCNQFGNQEPGNAAEIATFCATTYDVTFPILGKINVNGRDADPLYDWLTQQRRGILGSRRIKWNFTKFLVDRAGQVVRRFAPMTKPQAIESAVRAII